MGIDKKIINEINRYKSINNYITEQDAAVPDLGALTPPPANVNIDAPPPTPGGTDVEKIDVENDPDVEKIDDEGKSEEKGSEDTDSEELDITDLVTTQKDIQTKQDDYFENLFGQLNNNANKKIIYAHASAVKISFAGKIKAHIDGDAVWLNEKAEIEILPMNLNVIVPY